jgi:hypothetical protein
MQCNVSTRIAVLEDLEKRLIEIYHCMKEGQQGCLKEISERLAHVQYELHYLRNL